MTTTKIAYEDSVTFSEKKWGRPNRPDKGYGICWVHDQCEDENRFGINNEMMERRGICTCSKCENGWTNHQGPILSYECKECGLTFTIEEWAQLEMLYEDGEN